MTTTATTAAKSHGQRLQELRRSGAAGRHGDRRTKRNRERGTVLRNAINDQREN